MSLQVIAEAQEGCTDLQDQLNDKNNKVYTIELINYVEIIFLNEKIYIFIYAYFVVIVRACVRVRKILFQVRKTKRGNSRVLFHYFLL